MNGSEENPMDTNFGVHNAKWCPQVARTTDIGVHVYLNVRTHTHTHTHTVCAVCVCIPRARLYACVCPAEYSYLDTTFTDENNCLISL